MTNKTRIKTGFIANQAQESSKTGTSGRVIKIIALVAVAAIAFGIYKGVEMLLGFQTYQKIRNVSLQLKSPRLEEGDAFVDVTIHNANAYAISNPEFKFTISSPEGKEIGKGQIKIEGSVPTADQRTFANVDLGKVSGQPAKLHSDLVELEAKEPKDLPSGFPAKFSMAMTKEDQEGELKKLTELAPKYAPLKVALGIQAEKRNDWKDAEKLYEEAVELDADNANAHYRLGMALLRDNKEKVAVEHFEKALEISPNDPAVKLVLGQIAQESAPKSKRR